ncbi:hypothetical protein H0H81_011888 [Sphagnurus paluster]|uniref:60S acidic ribosomal protein P2 n=1 Tax=Sphagnurus paluster TaxID=117069 RepID=A0A9P7K3D7_9AGAR|nr:hypothetical protein H0H81_011888 [Sphagnurus paluster]
MRYIAAYLLLQIGGNASPSAADIKKLLGTVGIESDDSRLDSLISELSGKDINQAKTLQLISEGSAMLASVPSGGGGGGGAVAASSGGGAAAAAAEEKKEEKKKEEEKEEESDDDMGFGLFD